MQTRGQCFDVVIRGTDVEVKPPLQEQAGGQKPPITLTHLDAAALLPALLDDSGRGVYIMDQNGLVVMINRSLSALLGLPIEQVNGRMLWDIVPRAMAEERIRLARRAIQTGVPCALFNQWRGVSMVCMIRRLPPAPGREPSVIVVARSPADASLTNELIAAGYEVYHAVSNDMGQLGSLTRREREVLALIGDGLSTAAIAKRLHRTTRTIEHHRSSLGRKLNLTTRVQLAMFAQQSLGKNAGQLIMGE